MTDPKDNLPERDEKGIPIKESTPEPGISTPDEGVPDVGEEETIYIDPIDEIPPEEDEEKDLSSDAGAEAALEQFIGQPTEEK